MTTTCRSTYLFVYTLHHYNYLYLVGEERVDVSELVMDHESQKTHHGGAALVELDGTLGHLGFSIKRVPSKVCVQNEAYVVSERT
jgi:hypothetical protein